MWSRTETEEATGPLGEQEWQYRKGVGEVSQLVPEFRLEYVQGTPSLVFVEAPGEQVYVLEYRSKNWVVHTSTSVTASLWTAEAERTQLDEHLFYTELKWRWLRSKGSDYGHDFAAAEEQRDVEISRDMGTTKLRMGGFTPIEFA